MSGHDRVLGRDKPQREGQHLGAWRLLPSFQTQHPPGRQVTEMTKVGQVASVELGVSCWCLVGGWGAGGGDTGLRQPELLTFQKETLEI